MEQHFIYRPDALLSPTNNVIALKGRKIWLFKTLPSSSIFCNIWLVGWL